MGSGTQTLSVEAGTSGSRNLSLVLTFWNPEFPGGTVLSWGPSSCRTVWGPLEERLHLSVLGVQDPGGCWVRGCGCRLGSEEVQQLPVKALESGLRTMWLLRAWEASFGAGEGSQLALIS